MEACNAVERELERVLSKFTAINEHADRVLKEVTTHIEDMKRVIGDGK